MTDKTVTITLSDEAYDEIATGVLTTAVESGWGDWFDYKPKRGPDSWVTSAAVLDVEEGTIHHLGYQGVWAGIRRALADERLSSRIKADILQSITEGDAAQIDAEGADVIVQYALLGELVFG